MTLRTRPRTRTQTPLPSAATSGPGRPRRSDGRMRHRGGLGRRAARPGPDPGAVRRRAEALLGSSSPPGAGPQAPPGAEPAPPVRRPGALTRARPRPGAEPAPPPQDGAGADRAAGLGPGAGALTRPRAEPAPLPREDAGADRAPGLGPGAASQPDGEVGRPVAGALRSAVRERLPVWLQVRCAVEPRTVGAVAVVLAVAVGFAVQQYRSAGPQPVTAPAVIAPASAPVPAAAHAVGAAAEAGTGRSLTPLSSAALSSPGPGATGPGGARIVVDVGGKVREPGVRRLPAGSRVEDALAAAGGVRPGADTTGLNRARVLVDGEQVLVGVPVPPQAQPPPGGAGPGPGPLSLGSATVEQLDGLPGVGPVLARHIVDFRTARGGFRSVEELRQVNGIGERRFADLRPLVRP
ncbi:helix-hairpin-helix domain-containing protein [Streptomyces sp. NPDC058674]|uniref:helix-hairpin-helix domain-containing protein n=1 Tax=Streptomyces sp. NPDC058674 TaxID=3346592 RepID=UPI00364A90E8